MPSHSFRFYVYGGVSASVLALAGSSKAQPAGYQLVWADEFNDASLDESSWWYRADEKQQSIQLPSNVELDNGNLVLNLTPLDTPINGFDAAGAGVITQQRFHYGYYETRAKLGDGINDDNDSATDEGWWHAFWAMAAEGDENGHVLTTFPSSRRTEIDGYENGSNDLTRFSQHVLPWNASGQIITKLPSNDVTTIPAAEINDWHTYGFEWTPDEVRFFVDGVLEKVAIYPAEQYEHDEINVWLTAISTNNQSSDQERSEARYDYFRFYEAGEVRVLNGETLTVGQLLDISAPVGGSITASGFDGPASTGGGVAGDVVAESGSVVEGAGTIWGGLTIESGATLRVGQAVAGPGGGTPPVVTSEDFESFTPGVAFANNAATGLLPAWQFFDLGNTTNDVVYQVSGADGTASQPSDANLTGESQMLFQTATSIDFATEQNGSEPYAGALAVSSQFDTSGSVDIIEADFVFDGYGDASGGFLDAKIAFGFRDIDNWFSLSVVAGSGGGTSTQIDVIENVNGERRNIFGKSGTGSFSDSFPQDTLLTAEIIHDADLGFVAFTIRDKTTGDVLAQSYVIDDAFMADGLVGLGVNNDAVGIDNISVTTQDTLPFTVVQTLTVDGDFEQQALGMTQLDLLGVGINDQLEVTGQATLAGTLDIQVGAGYTPQLGDSFTLISADGGIAGQFDAISGLTLVNGLRLEPAYGAQGLTATVVVLGDLDGDNDVDDADFGAAFAAFTGPGNGPPSDLSADLDGDGDVDDADFGLAFAAFTGPGAAANVPEPAVLAPLLLVLAGVRRRR